MCVDVEPGMRTAAAVTWEAANKISLLVLALSLIDRGCCSSVYCSSTGCSAARAAAAVAASGVAAARGGGGPQEAIRSSRWWSRIVRVVGTGYVSHGPKAAVPRNPDGKKPTENQRMNVKKDLSVCTYMHLLVRDNTWVGPRNYRVGPYRACVSWASPPCDGPGRAVNF